MSLSALPDEHAGPTRIDLPNGERWYEIPLRSGVLRLPSATTVLDCLPKPWLQQWRERLILDHIRQALASGISNPQEDLETILADAHHAPNQQVEHACQFGTALHNAIQTRLETGKYPREDRDNPRLRPCLQGFEAWWRAQRMQPVQVETIVWSETFGYAGTCDAICRMPDRYLACCDWKSSSRVCVGHAAQACAYAASYEEMTGERIRQVMVVRVDKISSQVEVLRIPHADRVILMRGFLAALDVFNLVHNYKPRPERWTCGASTGS